MLVQTALFLGLWLAFPAFNLLPVDVCGQIEYGITLGKVMANLGLVLLMAGPTNYWRFS
ncbi:hypothetical protein METBIDRAFT_31695 [Metschnikowia bicuspidata var. bicuspidata NRRL YB-4993]|uniref:Uncharacterized protein n=1 Tax=Metschnikowia bicuspidata var. bicuspidata NRRL YB-4993 TaxID=869754 RepID=A0A1A0HAC8_9ASCO|nr:hypothetical protein METBIDRAFT_31695 [Metschnikowia bicuspidata var. bicuspidata NRRL YB-4993]OBA21084.1 hypothetical protein METBIDRAFT_31695 [Metschnikowia bicuspidata var. bicuspidata NRRL YB-4993]